MNIAETTLANSEQLNADDIIGREITVEILSVSRGPSKEQPVKIEITGFKPWYPCKTVRRILVACWGENGAEWVGRKAVLFNDQTVKFGGAAVGGIRIKRLSHIQNDITLMLQISRGRRQSFTVKKLDIKPRDFSKEAKQAKTVESLRKIYESAKTELNAEDLKKLADACAKRKSEL